MRAVVSSSRMVDTQGNTLSSHSCFKKCGVAILKGKSRPHKILKTWIHIEGRWVFVQLHIMDRTISLGSIYPHNTDKSQFLAQIAKMIVEFGRPLVLLGGD